MLGQRSATFNALFAATARGIIKPKTCSTFTYLGQLMLQTQLLAKEEYLETFDREWADVVWEAKTFNMYETESDPESGDAETDSPGPDVAASDSSESSPADPESPAAEDQEESLPSIDKIM